MQEFKLQEIDEVELRRISATMGALHAVDPDDFLYHYIVDRNGRPGVEMYFSGGRSDAMQALRGLERAIGGMPGKKVLEFAAGYGRVTRHARAVFDGHEYAASDIHPKATAFLASACEVPGLQSAHEPEDLAIGEGYDYVFVLSLFSHLPDKSFGRWLSALYSIIAPGGALLFTTHGDFARRKFSVPFEEMLDKQSGWGFAAESDQPDLDTSEYGTMIVTPSYVIGQIAANCPQSDLVRFESGTWFGLQDEWLIRKNP